MNSKRTPRPRLRRILRGFGMLLLLLVALVVVRCLYAFRDRDPSAAFTLRISDDAWQRDFELKVMGAVRLCRRVIPILRARGGGSIVNATIIGGKAPAARSLPTSVTRAAGINLTKSLANEYAADNIRVNTICIGLLKSAQWDRRAGDRPVEDLYRDMSARVPLGRIGEAEDYADLVAFLVSARATYITGVAINLDGGMSPVV